METGKQKIGSLPTIRRLPAYLYPLKQWGDSGRGPNISVGRIVQDHCTFDKACQLLDQELAKLAVV